MHNPNSLSDQRILEILAAAKVLDLAEPTSLESIQQNSFRSPNASRRHYRIWQSDVCRTQLYVAPDLADFYSRSEKFYQACNAIACRPLFRIRDENNDFAGYEFAIGKNAEESYLAGTLSPQELVDCVTKLDEALAQTTEPSTTHAAAAELERLFESLRLSNLLNNTDRALLDFFIAPKLRSLLLISDPDTRWSNGDFLLRNIIVTSAGPRLIDYEFARRTHFYCEDWARLIQYSPALPTTLLDWAQKKLGQRREAAEVYGLLRQMLFESKIKTVTEIGTQLSTISRRLLPIIDRWRTSSAPSLFLPAAAGEPIPGNTRAQVQVFYSSEAAFQEEHSIHAVIVEGIWSRVELPLPLGYGNWNIRLDPLHRPGVVEITSIEIRPGARASANPVPHSSVKPYGTCVIVATAPALTLIGYGSDPQLLLPTIAIEDSGPVWISIWIRWERLETALGRTLDLLVANAAAKFPGVPQATDPAVKMAFLSLERLQAHLHASERAHASTAESLSQISAALEQERAAHLQTVSKLESGANLFERFRAAVQERQRGFDQGTVQLLGQIRELDTACNKAHKEIALQKLAQQSGTERILREGLLAAQHRASDLENSLSWKMTAPGRRLVDIFRSTSKILRTSQQ